MNSLIFVDDKALFGKNGLELCGQLQEAHDQGARIVMTTDDVRANAQTYIENLKKNEFKFVSHVITHDKYNCSQNNALYWYHVNNGLKEDVTGATYISVKEADTRNAAKNGLNAVLISRKNPMEVALDHINSLLPKPPTP